MATDANTKTFLDDPESFKALIEVMPAAERAAYKGFTSLTAETAFPGRKMVIYTLSKGQPTDIEVITFGNLKVDWDNGPTFEVFDERGTTEIRAVPKRLRPRDVFLQVPQSFMLKFKGRQAPERDVDFVAHYGVLVKTRSKESLQVDEHTYCVTLNKFRERFPGLKFRY